MFHLFALVSMLTSQSDVWFTSSHIYNNTMYCQVMEKKMYIVSVHYWNEIMLAVDWIYFEFNYRLRGIERQAAAKKILSKKTRRFFFYIDNNTVLFEPKYEYHVYTPSCPICNTSIGQTHRCGRSIARLTFVRFSLCKTETHFMDFTVVQIQLDVNAVTIRFT